MLKLTRWLPQLARFEASGMAATPDGAALSVVCDEGGFLHIPLADPAQRRRGAVRPRGDFEGLAYTPDQRLLVLAEAKSAVWALDAQLRRAHRWQVRPAAKKKNRGYEGMTCTPDRLLLCLGGKKRSHLRSFALPVPGADALELRDEQRLPIPDLAGLCWHEGALLALSDRGRSLHVLRPSGAGWSLAARYPTPVDDLEAVAVAGGALFVARDGGGIWRAPLG